MDDTFKFIRIILIILIVLSFDAMIGEARSRSQFTQAPFYWVSESFQFCEQPSCKDIYTIMDTQTFRDQFMEKFPEFANRALAP